MPSISWMIQQTKKEGEDVFSINPVVGKYNDSRINEICNRVVGKKLYQALEQADTDFAEGDIGAGTGTICYGLKGGIGSACRTLVLDGKTYTIGVLVQSNFGATRDLKIEWKTGRREDSGADPEGRMRKQRRKPGIYYDGSGNRPSGIGAAAVPDYPPLWSGNRQKRSLHRPQKR